MHADHSNQSSGEHSPSNNNNHNKSGSNWAAQPHFKVEPKSYQIVQVYEAEGTHCYRMLCVAYGSVYHATNFPHEYPPHHTTQTLLRSTRTTAGCSGAAPRGPPPPTTAPVSPTV